MINFDGVPRWLFDELSNEEQNLEQGDRSKRKANRRFDEVIFLFRSQRKLHFGTKKSPEKKQQQTC